MAQSDKGVQLIAQERARHVVEEGWTPEHDAEHTGGTLALAGVIYATHAAANPDVRQEQRAHAAQGVAPLHWPWEASWWKPGPDDSVESRVRELTKAGALIAAEIDRLLNLQ